MCVLSCRGTLRPNILERVSDVLYRVQLLEGGSESVVLFNRMKPYVARSVSESWPSCPIITTECQPAERHSQAQSPAVPEVVKIRERADVSSMEERNSLLESAVEGGFSARNLCSLHVDTGSGELQQENGDQRIEVGDILEPCPQRSQPVHYQETTSLV